MSTEAGERVVDKEYLALLENKLKALKDPKKATAKQFLSDIATYKDQQLFKLITAGSPTQSGFDDDFADIVITPNYLRRVIAPQTCAINKLELVHLVKSDHVQVRVFLLLRSSSLLGLSLSFLIYWQYMVLSLQKKLQFFFDFVLIFVLFQNFGWYSILSLHIPTVHIASGGFFANTGSTRCGRAASVEIAYVVANQGFLDSFSLSLVLTTKKTDDY
ncbi:hypothetical protein Y032_0248g97 [Ancylostoma ceylanicum]|uniref:Uncharacterized protein n=1 Tax=Ancylostoma ceylanicum TaxID=53326 RepID=A0A016SDI0_9BILA|nr:hypothetical protein Y032_0248g97 [Ancylostoma ceylanicum]